jgi:hypothetical protein
MHCKFSTTLQKLHVWKMITVVKNSGKQQSVNFVSYSDCYGFKRDKSAYGSDDTGKEEQH